jgi:hypothetical protein
MGVHLHPFNFAKGFERCAGNLVDGSATLPLWQPVALVRCTDHPLKTWQSNLPSEVRRASRACILLSSGVLVPPTANRYH